MAAEGQCSSADQAESDGSDLHGQNAGPVEPDEHDLVYVPDNAKCPEGIRSQLRAWAVKHHIRIAAVNSLLDILRPRFTDLLKTQSALVSTRQSVPLEQLGSGEYVHFGLQSGLLRALDTDGVPLFKSSCTQVRPILVQVHHPRSKQSDIIFPVGIFCGTSKPTFLDEYLKAFIEEMCPLLSNGILHKSIAYKVVLRAIICDAPAKAFVKATKLFSGYYGCDKCCTKGVYLGRITYQSMDSPLRTDQSFADQTQAEHHKGISPLTSIGIPMVTRFPLDYMHLVCLGVVRKLIGYWLRGPLKMRLAHFSVMQLSGHLATKRQHITSDFARKLRAVDIFEQWKATEFRQFLLYSGPVVAKKILPRAMYEHFLQLHVGIAILSSSSMDYFIDYADQLLRSFVSKCKSIYGKESLIYNVHGLIHLANDCRQLGCLDNFSCFAFENYLKDLKAHVRCGKKPLEQLYSRIIEEQACSVVGNGSSAEFSAYEVLHSSCHSSGPALSYPALNQYQKVTWRESVIRTKQPDNCLLLSGNRIVFASNFLLSGSEILIVGKLCKSEGDFYTCPCRSSLPSVFKVSSRGSNLEVFLFSDVCKGQLLPFKGKDVFFPLFYLL
ncbi:uncharacterized protein LOC144113035 [Amblyomma americanum]